MELSLKLGTPLSRLERELTSADLTTYRAFYRLASRTGPRTAAALDPAGSPEPARATAAATPVQTAAGLHRLFGDRVVDKRKKRPRPS